MAFNNTGSTWSQTWRDASNEVTTMTLFAEPIDETNLESTKLAFQALIALFLPLQASPEPVVLSWRQQQVRNNAIPGDTAVQRELAISVVNQDSAGSTFIYTIPCADMDQVQLVPGGGDAISLDTVSWDTFGNAFGGSIVSPYGAEWDGFIKAKVVGRDN